MYSQGVLLSLAVRASPQAHDGAVPSTPLTTNPSAPGLRTVQVHVALPGIVTASPYSSTASLHNTPVVAPVNTVDASPASDGPAATGDGATHRDAATVVTAIALTPQLEAFITDRLAEDIDAAIEHLQENSLADMINEYVDEKISEALTEQTDTMESLEARIDELEEREPSGVDEDTFEELRLDVDELSEQIDQLKALRDTVAALNAACEALTARVAKLEHAAGGTPRDGETAIGGEG